MIVWMAKFEKMQQFLAQHNEAIPISFPFILFEVMLSAFFPTLGFFCYFHLSPFDLWHSLALALGYHLLSTTKFLIRIWIWISTHKDCKSKYGSAGTWNTYLVIWDIILEIEFFSAKEWMLEADIFSYLLFILVDALLGEYIISKGWNIFC